MKTRHPPRPSSTAPGASCNGPPVSIPEIPHQKVGERMIAQYVTQNYPLRDPLKSKQFYLVFYVQFDKFFQTSLLMHMPLSYTPIILLRSDTYNNEMMQLSYHDMPNFPNKNPRENAVIQDGCSIGILRVRI